MSLENNETPNILKKTIIYGVLLGVFSLITSVISLYITKTATGLITSAILAGVINYVLFIAVAVFFTIALRKAIGGYWSFSTALKTIFIMFAINTVISTLGTMMVNQMMPTLQEESIDNTLNLTIELLESTGVSDEQIDAKIAEIEQQKEDLANLTIGQQIKGLMVYFLLYFVVALIFAAIFKKEKPIFYKVPASNPAFPEDDNQISPNS
ncbi:DUF4199 domain-containing protein [Sphingobacterium sp. HJSM2_6]|uniref:DUF4199 domain-containing protein n=1 Tax=Sphingobacterium sp. HJSM2_6 TaxID=3366264 RepID=UPI003BED205F